MTAAMLPVALIAWLLAGAATADEAFQYSDTPLQQPPALSAKEVAEIMPRLAHYLTVGDPSVRLGRGATPRDRVYLLIDSILKARRAEGRSEFNDFERTSLRTLFERASRLGVLGADLAARHFGGEEPAGDTTIPAAESDGVTVRLEFPSYVVASRLSPWRLQVPYYFMITEAKREADVDGIVSDMVIAGTSFAPMEGHDGASQALLMFAYSPVEQCQNFNTRWQNYFAISPKSLSNETLLPGAGTYTSYDSKGHTRKEITLSSREGQGCAAFALLGPPGVFETNRVSYLDFIKSFSDFSATPPAMQEQGAALLLPCPPGQYRFENACVANPSRIHYVQPIYPREARKKKIEGQVELKAGIDIDGSIISVEVLKCTHPDAGFEEAAMAAVRQWRYTTPMVNGWPRKIRITVVVSFELD